MTDQPAVGPLGAEYLRVGDYAVRLEDHPLVKAGEVHRVTEIFRGGYLGFARPVGGEWSPNKWRKCDADGLIPWSGGENPVPGQKVEVHFASGLVRRDHVSDAWTWTHGTNIADIIAFRLTNTGGEVGASGAERGHGPKCWGRTSFSDEMAHCYCGTTDRPQPTAPSVDLAELKRAIDRLLPITITETPDYAEVGFGECRAQAMTMEPDTWLALNQLPALIAQIERGEG